MTLPEADARLMGTEYGPRRGPLTDEQVDRLARYNQHRAQGLVHTPEYVARMAELQARWNEWAGEYVGELKPKRRWWSW